MPLTVKRANITSAENLVSAVRENQGTHIVLEMTNGWH